jgi:hypothetical protein
VRFLLIHLLIIHLITHFLITHLPIIRFPIISLPTTHLSVWAISMAFFQFLVVLRLRPLSSLLTHLIMEALVTVVSVTTLIGKGMVSIHHLLMVVTARAMILPATR